MMSQNDGWRVGIGVVHSDVGIGAGMETGSGSGSRTRRSEVK